MPQEEGHVDISVSSVTGRGRKVYSMEQVEEGIRPYLRMEKDSGEIQVTTYYNAVHSMSDKTLTNEFKIIIVNLE